MNKIFIISIISFLSIMAYPQKDSARIAVVAKDGATYGYAAEDIESVYFAQVEGSAIAMVEYLGYKRGLWADTLMVSVARSEGCGSFQIDVMPRSLFESLGANAAAYVAQSSPQKYCQDFQAAEIAGFDDGLLPGCEYVAVTVAYDLYNVAGEVSIASFITPPLGGEGLAEVEITVGAGYTNEYGEEVLAVSYIPNENCSVYHTLVVSEDEYDLYGWTEQDIMEYLMMDDNEQYNSGYLWNLHLASELGYWLYPNAYYYAFALAKNSVGEWGTLSKAVFRTSDHEADGDVKPVRGILHRKPAKTTPRLISVDSEAAATP